MMSALLLSWTGKSQIDPFRLAGVPPPMAHNELSLDSNAIDVAFSKSGTRIAVLMNNSFAIYIGP